MAIITIGPRTDAIIDNLRLPHSFIPDLQNMTCTIRSSSWIKTLQSAEWGLDYEQALTLSRALLADIKADSLKVRTLTILVPWLMQHLVSDTNVQDWIQPITHSLHANIHFYWFSHFLPAI